MEFLYGDSSSNFETGGLELHPPVQAPESLLGHLPRTVRGEMKGLGDDLVDRLNPDLAVDHYGLLHLPDFVGLRAGAKDGRLPPVGSKNGSVVQAYEGAGVPALAMRGSDLVLSQNSHFSLLCPARRDSFRDETLSTSARGAIPSSRPFGQQGMLDNKEVRTKVRE